MCPVSFNSANALGLAAFLSTVMTRGSLLCEAVRVVRKNSSAAFASLVELNW